MSVTVTEMPVWTYEGATAHYTLDGWTQKHGGEETGLREILTSSRLNSQWVAEPAKNTSVLALNPELFCKWKTPFLFLLFVRLHPGHMDVPRLGAESEPQLPVYTTATATGRSKLPLQPTPQLITMPDP